MKLAKVSYNFDLSSFESVENQRWPILVILAEPGTRLRLARGYSVSQTDITATVAELRTFASLVW